MRTNRRTPVYTPPGMKDKPSKPKTSKNRRWSESEALAAAERLGQGDKVRELLGSPTLADSLRRLGLPVAEKNANGTGTTVPTPQPEKKKALKNNTTKTPTQEKKPAKRRGVSTTPIFQSLEMTPARSRWGTDWLALDFPGARLLSYNELYSILQFRKYEAFRYKKICQNAVTRALSNPDQVNKENRPYFDGPTRLTLLRVGTKGMDREALTVIFKYLTDMLKRADVIEDDNPNIIVDIQTIQGLGEPRLAMKLERLNDWIEPPVPDWSEWQ